jgi:hypothetical protein
MALQQTKDIKIKKSKRTIHKEDLAKELKVSTAIINEYILGDKDVPAPATLIRTPSRFSIGHSVGIDSDS